MYAMLLGQFTLILYNLLLAICCYVKDKLCGVLSDRLAREHFIEVFRLYSEEFWLLARKHILLDNEKANMNFMLQI